MTHTGIATPDVRVGQIWKDNDPRSYGRRLRVESVDETHATVVQVVFRGATHDNATPGRHTRIALKRFRPTSTGYVLVQDVAETAPVTVTLDIDALEALYELLRLVHYDDVATSWLNLLPDELFLRFGRPDEPKTGRTP